MAHERIVCDPAIMLGKPVIRNTRLTVEHILRELSGGATEEDLVREYPGLTPEDVRAAQAYAADYLAGDSTVFG